jgi:hypothetical protein
MPPRFRAPSTTFGHNGAGACPTEVVAYLRGLAFRLSGARPELPLALRFVDGGHTAIGSKLAVAVADLASLTVTYV